MDFGHFPGDLRRRASYADGFTNGFPPNSASSGFGFSGERASPMTPVLNPFLNQHSRRNLLNPASMVDTDLGFTGSHPFLRISGSRNLHGCSRLDQDLSLYDSFLDISSRREGLVHSSHGEVSMGGYVSDGDCHRLGLLSLQDFPNPKPNHMGFEEHMSHHNRDFQFEPINRQTRRNISLLPQNSRLGFLRNDALDTSLMYSANRIVPPLSAMGDSQELDKKFTPKFVKNSSFNEQDFPLDVASMVEICGSVYLMAKDQMGCRILQKVVEEGSFLDTIIIFREVINHVIELGMDPFGNYFIQKLLQVCNEEQRTQILIMLTSKPGLLVKISLNTYGTRVVQKLIETVNTKEQISLVKSALKPGFLSLVRDLNGNHVIGSCLKSFGPNDNKFVLEAATRFCAEIATHRHGCCLIQRCVLHSVGAEREKLVAEVSRNSLLLAQDPFGNYVVQCIIEQKMGAVNVMFELRGNYVKLATQKFSSHVVEQCLRHYPESRSQIVSELISVPNFEHLLQDPFANYVIQSALLVTKGYVRASLVEKIRRCGNLKTSPYCKRIFSKSRLLKM